MKEVKRTPVPLPGSKPRAKSKSNGAVSKAQLSAELIGSSDDDSSPEKTPQPKAAPKPTTTIAVHRPNGAAKSKAISSAKAPPKSIATPKAKPAPKKATPKQIGTEEQAAEVLSSSEVTDDEEVPRREIQTKLPGNKARTDAASASSSESSSESSSDEEPATTRTPQASQASARTPKKVSHAVEFRPAQTYVPPKGYSAVPCTDKTTSESTRIFDNLEGKQIWHITVPAGVSLKHLEEMAMDSALKGETVLEHKGTSYAFAKADQSDGGAREVMLPRKDGFKSAGARITQCLNLQAVVQLPHLTSRQADQNTGSEAAASITRSTIRAPRPQLKGLKMRFLPTGFGNGAAGTLGESDSENDAAAEADETNELQLPPKKDKNKRKHREVNGDVPADAPAKKAKKHRTQEDKEAKREKKEKKRAREGVSAKP